MLVFPNIARNTITITTPSPEALNRLLVLRQHIKCASSQLHIKHFTNRLQDVQVFIMVSFPFVVPLAFIRLFDICRRRGIRTSQEG
ncbi:hypothetical protein BS17DRAFT_214099 [Gyrodon lividus]|nr:hypothetical protein BS17DRAFT_214099 [Gyrodon lividus]